jgi:hypothetical protein
LSIRCPGTELTELLDTELTTELELELELLETEETLLTTELELEETLLVEDEDPPPVMP